MTVVPAAWPLATLGELVDVLDSRRIPISATMRAQRPGPVPYYGASGRVGRIDSHLFDEPLVLLGEDGVQFFDSSKSKAYLVDGPAWVNNHAHVLRTKPNVERRFLLHYLNHFDYRGYANGTTRLKLTKSAMCSIPVPLPHLSEQQRIVDILEDHLSRLDAASSELSSAATRLKALLRAARHASTENIDETVPLSSLVTRIEAGRSFGSAARQAKDDEWGIVKVSAMTWGAFNETENKVVLDPSRIDERFEIRPGDLLVSRANTSAYVGATVLVGSCRPRLLLSDKSLRLVPHEGVDPRYLCAVLQAPAARSQMSDLATGTKDSMRNISQAALLSIQLPNATPTQQAEVVGKVAAVEDQVRRLRLEVDRAKIRQAGLRRALLDAAFSGRL